MGKLMIISLLVVLSWTQLDAQIGPRNDYELNPAIFHALNVLLRGEMRTGNPYTGFPVLAPFRSPRNEVDWRFGHLVDLEGELRNLRIDGLDGFQIIEASLNLRTMRFTFDFNFPQILFTGWYNLNGRFGGLIPIFGQGNFVIDPRNFRAHGEAHVRVALNGGLSLNSLSVRLGIQSLHTDIQGILGGGDLSNLLNRMVMDLVPGFFRTFEDQISAGLSAFLLPRINPLLSGLTLDDIRNMLP